MNISFAKFRYPVVAGLVLLFAANLCSCVSTKHVTYMQGAFDTAKLSKIEYKEPIIRKGDILSIVVYSDNPAATALFNQQGGAAPASGSGFSATGGGTSIGGAAGGASATGGATGGSGGGGGYLVDERGNIQFQAMGVLHVEGMLRSQLEDTLQNRLKEYLQNPYCVIRFLNYHFTMLGEVAHQGVFGIPNEHLNLFEAIGMAGDLTVYGLRENVLIIRDSLGVRTFGRLDLTRPDVMVSRYFYIQPSDIIYVEASKKKIGASDQLLLRNLTIATTLISTFAIIYSIFR